MSVVRSSIGVSLTVYTALAAFAAAGCGHPQPFLWVDAVPKVLLAPESTAVIQPGDVITVRVWNQESNSVDRARVREDGKISIPFLQDVEVAQQEPAALARRLETRLKAFINNPVVTVTVHERRPLRVSVLGRVTRPGVYDLDAGAGVLQAVAASGGLTPFADEDSIFVIRNGYWADLQAPARIRFRYLDLRGGRMPASIFALRYGDVVVVE
jgi:polysaccharide export outer membrane protein